MSEYGQSLVTVYDDDRVRDEVPEHLRDWLQRWLDAEVDAGRIPPPTEVHFVVGRVTPMYALDADDEPILDLPVTRWQHSFGVVVDA